MMPPLNAPTYAHAWGTRQRQKFKNIAKSEAYVGEGAKGKWGKSRGGKILRFPEVVVLLSEKTA
jgi:hypothetical protein